MTACCQRCGAQSYDWNIRQAEFNVGRVKYWKVQLCEPCTKEVEAALLVALRTTAEAK